MADYEELQDLVAFNQNTNNQEHERLWQGIDTSNTLRIAGDAAVSNAVQSVRNTAGLNSTHISNEVIYRIEGDLFNQNQYSQLQQSFTNEWGVLNLGFLDVKLDLQGQINAVDTHVAAYESQLTYVQTGLINLIGANQSSVLNDLVKFDTRIKKYEYLLSDITIDSNQITIDNGEINMGAWTILSQAREWDLEILRKFDGLKVGTQEQIDEALSDFENALPNKDNIIAEAMTQLSNQPIIQQLDNQLGSALERIDGVSDALGNETLARQNEILNAAQQSASDLEASAELLQQQIVQETAARIDELQRESAIRLAQIAAAATDIRADIDVDIEAILEQAGQLQQQIETEEAERIAAISLLNDGVTAEVQARKDADTATLSVIDNYKISNDSALANISQNLNTAIDANSVTAQKVEAIDTRLTTTEQVAASAVSKADAAVTANTALASQVNALTANIADIEEAAAISATAFNALSTQVDLQGTALTSQSADITSLQNSITGINNNLNNKADSTALTATNNRVTVNENAISAQASLVNSLSGTVETHTTNITAAQTAANNAATAAGSKGKVFFQNSAPAVADRLIQNLWIDTTGGANTPKRWLTNNWVAVSDKIATDALTAANAANTALTSKADSSAVTALNNSVTAIDGRVTANASDITTLKSNVQTINGTLTTKADSTALTALDNKVTSIDGRTTTQGTSITALESSLSTTNTNVTAAQTAANNANTLAGGKGKVFFQNSAPAVADRLVQNLWIDTTGNANTPKRWLTNAWVPVSDKVASDALAAANAANTALTTKADSSAVTTLSNRVDVVDGKATTNANSITALSGRMTTVEGSLATKVDVSVLNTIYTTTQTDAAIAGQITAYNAALQIGGTNLLIKTHWKVLADLGLANEYRVGNISSVTTFTVAYLQMIGIRFNNAVSTEAELRGYITPPNRRVSRVTQGRTYTLSFVGQATFSELNTVHLLRAEAEGEPFVITAAKAMAFGSGGATRRSITFVAPWTSATVGVLIGTSQIWKATDWWSISELQLEEGNKATPWSPSIQDTAEALDANASAIQSTNTEVVRINGVVTANSNAITSLQNSLTSVNNSLTTKADVTALNNLDSKVTSIDGRTTTNATDLTNLTTRVTTVEGSMSTKADATALTALTTRVTNAEGVNTSQGTSITSLQNTINHATTGLSTKASTSALNTLDGKVTTIDGKVTANTTSITNLNTRVNSVEGTLLTKADATALTLLDTKVTQLDNSTVINSSDITTLRAGLYNSLSTLKILGNADSILPSAVNGNSLSRVSLVDNADSTTGKVIQFGTNTDATDYVSFFPKDNIAIDINKLYRVKYRYRRIAGANGIYLGLHCLNADKTNSITSSNGLQAPTYAPQGMYMVSNAKPTLGEWVIGEYYLKGKSAGASVGSGTMADPRNFPNLAAYFTPLILANYNTGTGQQELDYIIIEDAEAIGMSNANADAITATNAEVLKVDGKVTANTNNITALTTRMTSMEGTKADASALNNYYTKTEFTAQAKTVAAGEISSFNAALQVGGANLQAGTRTISGYASYGAAHTPVKVNEVARTDIIRTVKTVTSAQGIALDIPHRSLVLQTGKQYVITFLARGSVMPNYMYVMASKADGSNTSVPFTREGLFNETTFIKFTGTYTAVADRTNAYMMIANISGAVGTWFDIAEVMVQEGNKATPWEPAFLDAQAGLDANAVAITSTNTEVTNIKGDITTISNSVTNLKNSIEDHANGLNALGSALDSLDVKVENVEGELLTMATSIQGVEAKVIPLKASGSWKISSRSKRATSMTVQSAIVEGDRVLSKRIDELSASIGDDTALAISELKAEVFEINGQVFANSQSLLQLTTEVGDNKAALQVQALALNGIRAEYSIKLDVNGLVSGIGLINDGTTSAIGINAEYFYVGKPSNGKKPFMITTSTQVINGITYPAGTWIDVALIANASIGSALIADAAITRAKIADLAVDNAKIENIHGNKIFANTIVTGHLAAGAVTADKLNVTELSAITSNLGTMISLANASLPNGERTVVTGAKTEVYDAAGRLVMRMGRW